MKIKNALVYLFSIFLIASVAKGQVPKLINYQGFLTNQNDEPLNGNLRIRFSLYSTASGGSALWSETQTNVNVDNGLYSVPLGSVNQIPASVFNGGTRYLGIRVGNDSEMAPRHKIVSVGYAMRAETANDVPDGSITGNELAEQVDLGSSSVTGRISVQNRSGQDRGVLIGERLKSPALDYGVIELYGSTNNELAFLGGLNIPKDPTHGGLILFHNGNSKAAFQSAEWGTGLWLDATDGSTRIFTGVHQDNAGYQLFDGQNDKRNVEISFPSSDPNRGGIWLYDSSGQSKLASLVDSKEAGRIVLYGQNGNHNVSITRSGSFANHGSIYLSDDDGNTKVTVQVLSTKGGGVFTTTGDGSDAVWITTETNGSASTEAGYVRVNDRHGNEVITLDGRDGSITAASKNFRIPHPANPFKEIYYSSLEGPEAAAYVRGTASLINGETTIILPEHFSLVASNQNVTVQVTPLSEFSKGLAVVAKSTTRIRVKELNGGRGNYDFDYFVQAVRIGFANFQVIRDKSAILGKGTTSSGYEPKPTDGEEAPRRSVPPIEK